MITNPKTASFTEAATFDDGSAMPDGTVAKFQFGLGQVTGIYTTVVDDPNSVPAKVAGVPFSAPMPAVPLPYGNWFAAVRAVTKDVPPIVSKWSNEISFMTAAPVPSAPVNFSLA